MLNRLDGLSFWLIFTGADEYLFLFLRYNEGLERLILESMEQYLWVKDQTLENGWINSVFYMFML